MPLIGDWDGDGDDQVGVFRGSRSQFFLDRNGNGTIDDGEEIRRWTIKGAWISEIAYSDFDSASSALMSFGA